MTTEKSNVIEVSFERCTQCDKLFRPGDVTVNGKQGGRFHAHGAPSCYERHCREVKDAGHYIWHPGGDDDAA